MKILRRFGGLIALGIAWVLRWAFGSEVLFERLFFHGLFPAVKTLQWWISPLWILPGYFLMAIGLVLWLLWRFPRKWRNKGAVLRFFRRLLNLAGATVACFLIVWGYNYTGPTLMQRMGIPESDPAVHPSPVQLYLEVMESAADYRGAIPGVHDTLPTLDFTPPSDSAIVRAVVDLLYPFGYPDVKGVRVRRILPDGTLRRLGIAGIYNPFTGEANIDGIYGAVSGTFTTAHEVAHACGITGEAESNFVAYLALIQMENPLARYAAEYSLWRHTAKTVNKSLDKEDRAKLVAAIPTGLQTDRSAIAARLTGHRPYFPEVSDAVNHNYLKLQGIQAGTADYDRFVNLWLDWRFTKAIKE